MKNINSDLAYDYVKKRILGGEFLPGQSLMTKVLAKEIGVSRTPIRDALRQLEADGLVTIKARIGASVKTMDIQTFRESCELRLALESHAAGLAARNWSEENLHEIALALEEMRKVTRALVDGAMQEKQLPILVREDVRFHLAIIAAAKNKLMKKEILRLHLVNRVVSSPAESDHVSGGQISSEDRTHREKVLASHEQIYHAIAASDAAAARQAMEEHIQDIIDRSIHRLVRVTADAKTRLMTAEEAIYIV